MPEYDLHGYAVSKVILVSASGEIALNDFADPTTTSGNSDQIAQKINDYLHAPPTAEALTVWQALWFPLLTGSCFNSLLVLWMVDRLIAAGIWLKRSRSG
jgi:hypothetical protein